MTRNKKASPVWAIILLLMISGGMFFKSYYNTHMLENTQKIITDCGELFDIDSSIALIIPTGTEHYYYAFDKDDEKVYVIKASKSWYEENFDEEGRPLHSVMIAIDGAVRHLNYKEEDEVKDFFAEYPEITPAYDTKTYIDITYKSEATYAIILGIIGFIITIGMGIVTVVKKDLQNTPAGYAIMIGMVIYLYMMLVLIDF